MTKNNSIKYTDYLSDYLSNLIEDTNIEEKLTKIKPPTLGAASRVSGVTPPAIIAILRYLKKNKNRRAA